jgi:nucleotide-binding universal stress UspA family protein
MYDDVLFPTDGSPGTDQALEHAIDQALRDDATLHLLYVVEENLPVVEVGDPVLFDELEADGEGILEEAASQATASGVERIERTVTGGSPYRQILDYVEDQGIDLVVMGTHGRRGVDRFLLGSVAEKVVRAADCPVMTVRGTGD